VSLASTGPPQTKSGTRSGGSGHAWPTHTDSSDERKPRLDNRLVRHIDSSHHRSSGERQARQGSRLRVTDGAVVTNRIDSPGKLRAATAPSAAEKLPSA